MHTLRTQFSKEKNKQKNKSGSAADSVMIRWKYFEQLVFLQDSVQLSAKRQSNLSVPQESVSIIYKQFSPHAHIHI